MKSLNSAVLSLALFTAMIGTSVLADSPANATTQRYVDVGMPFNGGWGYPSAKGGSGDPAEHTTYTSAYLWGNWAEEFLKNGVSVVQYVTAPNGGTIALEYVARNTNGSCDGSAGFNVVVRIKLDGSSGLNVFVHLETPVRGTNGVVPPIVNGVTVLGKTKFWPECRAWKVKFASGVHTHFEMRSTDSNNRACWYPYTVEKLFCRSDRLAVWRNRNPNERDEVRLNSRDHHHCPGGRRR